MGVEDLLSDEDWDQPVYKLLARNDTGTAPGHQGGCVITKELLPFFPSIASLQTSTDITAKRSISAHLFWNGEFLCTVLTDFRYETRKRQRAREYRLTRNLGPILGTAKPNDVLLIQRRSLDLDVFRLMVYSKGSQDYDWIRERIEKYGESRRWGVLGTRQPMTVEDLAQAQNRLQEREAGELVLFDTEPLVMTSTATRYARSTTFRTRVLDAYGGTCAVCDKGLRTPDEKTEVEAAHIAPKNRGGTDDVRNGLALCRSHHWAFDNGLFGVAEDRTLLMPQKCRDIPENADLRMLVGKPIREAEPPPCRASDKAFSWHRDNIVVMNR